MLTKEPNRRRFIVNPGALASRGRRALDAVETWFRERTGAFDAVVPSDRGAAVRATRDALRAGVRRLVAVGGDGTVNAVANGFFDDNGAPLAADATLAVAPWGTGCDYFRSLAGARDWREIVLSGRPFAADVGRVEWLGAGRLSHFVNAASVGMSAEVVRRQKESPKWLPPLVSYSLPSLTTLFSFAPVPLTVTLDGKAHGGEFLSAFFAKGTYLGGGMRFGGNVALDDGRLDVTLLHGMGLAQSLPRFGKIFTGRFHGDSKITKTTAAVVELTAAKPLPVEFDGELEGETNARITVLPKAIRFLVP